jgi:hypothetical protein
VDPEGPDDFETVDNVLDATQEIEEMLFVSSKVATHGSLPCPTTAFADLSGFEKQVPVTMRNELSQRLDRSRQTVKIQDVVVNGAIDDVIETPLKIDIDDIAFNQIEVRVIKQGPVHRRFVQLNTGYVFSLAGIEQVLAGYSVIAADIKHAARRRQVRRDPFGSPQCPPRMTCVVIGI